jgi:cell wall-associated NlpC family hydrolase
MEVALLAALAALAPALAHGGGAVAPAAAARTADVAAAEAVVIVGVENMYSVPDDTKDVVSQATLGQTVVLVQEEGDFLQVRTPDGYLGWLARPAVAPYSGATSPRYAHSGRVVEITSLMANVYRDADVTTARPKVQAPLATRLELLAEGPGERWLTIRLPGGETGYLQRGDATAVTASVPPRRGSPLELVATARRFLGTPYLWGGMTARGIDCSGLVSRVYLANGVTLPRDADLQFDDPGSRPVARGALRPGDLVFFGRDAQHITHVGIYAGGGRFVSATTHAVPVVREDRLADPYWAKLYQGARRPR